MITFKRTTQKKLIEKKQSGYYRPELTAEEVKEIEKIFSQKLKQPIKLSRNTAIPSMWETYEFYNFGLEKFQPYRLRVNQYAVRIQKSGRQSQYYEVVCD